MGGENEGDPWAEAQAMLQGIGDDLAYLQQAAEDQGGLTGDQAQQLWDLAQDLRDAEVAVETVINPELA